MKVSKFNCTDKQRNTTIYWLLDVVKSFKNLPSTYDLCIAVFDDVMNITDILYVNTSKIQLVAISCLYISILYNESMHNSIDDMVYVCGNAYSKNDVLQIIPKILTKINCNLNYRTLNYFLNKFRNDLSEIELTICNSFKNVMYTSRHYQLYNSMILIENIIKCVRCILSDDFKNLSSDNNVLYIYSSYKRICNDNSYVKYNFKHIEEMCNLIKKYDNFSIDENISVNITESTFVNINKKKKIPIIKHGNWQKLQFLGSGTFGQVYKINLDNVYVAAKKYNSESKYLYSLIREISNLHLVNHRNVCSILGVDLNESENYVFFELMKCTIHSLFNVNTISSFPVNIDLKLNWILQILDGLSYLHNVGIIHRDISSSNIMIKYDNTVSIIDLGSSRMVECVTDTDCYTDEQVTEYFRPIEMLVNNFEFKYSFEIDVWSCACVISQILYNQPIIYGINKNDVIAKIFSHFGKINENDGLSLELNNLSNNNTSEYLILKEKYPNYCEILDKMFVYNPKNRLSSKEALNLFSLVKN